MDPAILGSVGYAISAMDIASSVLYAVSNAFTSRLLTKLIRRGDLKTNMSLIDLACFSTTRCAIKPKDEGISHFPSGNGRSVSKGSLPSTCDWAF